MVQQSNSEASPHFSRVTWDVIVIGAGMGGGTLGWALAEMGHRVLFLEKGLNMAQRRPGQLKSEKDIRLHSGYWPEKMSFTINGNRHVFFPPLGCGTGGTTLVYAAALERFSRLDFEPSSSQDLKKRGSSFDGWPLDYDAFLPYYQKAESLFEVRGTRNPSDPTDSDGLLKPQPLSEQESHFKRSFEEMGLRPYCIHVGIKYQDGCTECLGHVCEKQCKSDANRICIQPVLAADKARIIDQCEVTRIEADARSVRHVVCVRDGKEIRLKARTYVLAASAYITPVILLNSQNAHWPNGLLNNHGLVGRNLMFHLSDFVALWPTQPCSKDGANKSLSLRDFYEVDGCRLGSFQSTGLEPTRDNIYYFLRSALDLSTIPWPRKTVLRVLRKVAKLAHPHFKRCSVFSTILEDYPYSANRIQLANEKTGAIRVVYNMSKELKQRNRQLRKLLKTTFKRHKPRFLASQPRLNFGHPSGTCRFGTDPQHSVLNPQNRAHEVDNLYVVDASFFPSSSGANPSLTIAANALRVAEIIDSELKK